MAHVIHSTNMSKPGQLTLSDILFDLMLILVLIKQLYTSDTDIDEVVNTVDIGIGKAAGISATDFGIDELTYTVSIGTDEVTVYC